MISNKTTSLCDAYGVQQSPLQTRVVVRKWIRMAPLVLAALLAVGAVFAASNQALAQDDVLDYVESQFGGYGLRFASAVVVSPDDNFLYVTSILDDAVVLFSRDSSTGELTYIATYVNGENNVTGLSSPLDLAVSSDGANLYVVGEIADLLSREINGTVVVFKRELATGKLTFVETLVNGEDSVTDMYAPDAVAVSPDGDNVYVAGDTALTVFRRDASDDGKLSFVESEKGQGGGESFQLRDVIVPSNNRVYVTAHLRNAVAVLARDTGDDGKVRVIETFQDGVDGVTGLLGAEMLSVSPDGANIYATGNVSGTVAVFDRLGNGRLTFVEALFNGENGVDGIGGARSVETSPDGKNVYVEGVTQNALTVFSRDGSGKLSFVECFTANATDPDNPTLCQTDTPGLEIPSAIAISDDGKNVYPTALAGDSVSTFARNSGSGELTFVEILNNSDGGVPGLGGADDVDVSPDGKNVYVAAGRDASVVVFDRDSGARGKLDFVETQENEVDGVTGLFEPSSVTVSPDGANVYVTNRDSVDRNRGSIVVFSRDATTGTLSYVETKLEAEDGVAGLAGAWDAAVSPNGANLYATGITSGTVAVFSREASTGKLKFLEQEMEGMDGVTGLRGAAGIVVSADGQNVYVTGSESNSIVVFRRNSTNGRLTFVESETNGEGGVQGLGGAVSVDISADGQNVYVASLSDGRVVVFKRDADNGKLDYAGALSGAAEEESAQAEQQIDKLYWSVAVSPDGKYVFAVRWELTTSIVDPTGAVVVFARQPETGILSTAQVLRNDEGGVRGMREPTSLTVSADGANNVYATSVRDSAALVFEVVGSAEYTDLQYLPYVSSD